MYPTELFIKLSGLEEPKAAAKALASQWRARLRQESLWSEAVSEPLTTDALKAIGKLRRIIEYKFNAALASEGLIIPLPAGGFSVSVARSDGTSRARYTLAHEIAHTFFYDVNKTPPRRLTPYDRGRSAPEEIRSATRLEERFCDAFAAELLFPSDAAKFELEDCTHIGDTSELLASIERVSQRWSVSVEMALGRLNEVQGLGATRERVISIMRWKPNSKTGRDPGVRVTQSFPRPCGCWFLPTNTRANSVGLTGASLLFDWWQRFKDRDPNTTYRRSGVFNLKYGPGKTPTVLQNERLPGEPCLENLLLWQTTTGNAPKWRRVSVEAPVTYRLYAVNPIEVYSVALINLSQPSA
jgi:hypothetical protein